MKNKREIKFRVWNLDRKEWADFGYLDMNGNFMQEGVEYHKYNYKVMQYIGLKDRNGKEIYEDDIIQFWDDNIYLVQYDEDNTQFNCGDVYNNPLTKQCEEGLEVIGNAYENPEFISKLLKEK